MDNSWFSTAIAVEPAGNPIIRSVILPVQMGEPIVNVQLQPAVFSYGVRFLSRDDHTAISPESNTGQAEYNQSECSGFRNRAIDKPPNLNDQVVEILVPTTR